MFPLHSSLSVFTAWLIFSVKLAPTYTTCLLVMWLVRLIFPPLLGQLASSDAGDPSEGTGISMRRDNAKGSRRRGKSFVEAPQPYENAWLFPANE